MKSTSLILVRHAHRDTSNRELDNGLSRKGQKQVLSLEKQLIRRLGVAGLKNFEFASSPKRRCVETLFALSTFSPKGLKVQKLLDEQGAGESVESFSARVLEMVGNLTHFGGDHVWCSHGDWIPVGANLLVGEPLDLKKGDALIFIRAPSGEWELSDTILTKS